MACPEKIRLLQLYEAAIRRWAQLQASSQLLAQSTYLTEEVRKRTLIECNAAKARLTMHQRHCTKCRAPKRYRSA